MNKRKWWLATAISLLAASSLYLFAATAAMAAEEPELNSQVNAAPDQAPAPECYQRHWTYGFEECCEELGLEWHADIALHGWVQRTDLGAGSGTLDEGGADIYWGEVGLGLNRPDWRAWFSVLTEAGSNDIRIHEAFLRYQPGRGMQYLQLGRMVLPFADKRTFFPSFAETRRLGFTTAEAVGAGIGWEGGGLAAFAYNPEVTIGTEGDSFSDYSIYWEIASREQCRGQAGYQFSAGYNSNLAAADANLGGLGQYDSRVGAYHVFARYDSPGGQHHLLSERVWADSRFAAVDLDANADGVGDRPEATNVEYAYEPRPGRMWGFRYQHTKEMLDAASNRLGVFYGEQLDQWLDLKLELSRGEYGDYTSHGEGEDLRFVTEFRLDF